MQVTEKRNFMDIFYINCFSHSLSRLSRARNISCLSCFLTFVYAIYSRNCIHLGETAKQKRRVDTYTAKERKWGNAEMMPRPLNLSMVIHSLEAMRPEATLFSPHQFQ